MKTALLILLLAFASHAAEVVGLPWTYPTAKAEGVTFVVYHRPATNGVWRAITIVPSTEVAESEPGKLGYEIAVKLQNGPSQFSIVAVKAGKPSLRVDSEVVVIGVPTIPPIHPAETALLGIQAAIEDYLRGKAKP